MLLDQIANLDIDLSSVEAAHEDLAQLPCLVPSGDILAVNGHVLTRILQALIGPRGTRSVCQARPL